MDDRLSIRATTDGQWRWRWGHVIPAGNDVEPRNPERFIEQRLATLIFSFVTSVVENARSVIVRDRFRMRSDTVKTKMISVKFARILGFNRWVHLPYLYDQWFQHDEGRRLNLHMTDEERSVNRLNFALQKVNRGPNR